MFYLFPLLRSSTLCHHFEIFIHRKLLVEFLLGQSLHYMDVQFIFGASLVLSGKESACSAGDLGLIRGLGRAPGGLPNPVLLPGESHGGQRSLVGYSPWGCKESDMTEMTQHATKSFLDDSIILLFSLCLAFLSLLNFLHSDFYPYYLNETTVNRSWNYRIQQFGVLSYWTPLVYLILWTTS